MGLLAPKTPITKKTSFSATRSGKPFKRNLNFTYFNLSFFMIIHPRYTIQTVLKLVRRNIKEWESSSHCRHSRHSAQRAEVYLQVVRRHLSGSCRPPIREVIYFLVKTDELWLRKITGRKAVSQGCVCNFTRFKTQRRDAACWRRRKKWSSTGDIFLSIDLLLIYAMSW